MAAPEVQESGTFDLVDRSVNFLMIFEVDGQSHQNYIQRFIRYFTHERLNILK